MKLVNTWFLVLLFPLIIPTPLLAACDLTLTDNTFKGGLDINDVSPETRANIAKVESFHFTPEVESLTRGSTGKLPSDLEYTLRHVPNHYRALASYAKWELANPRAARTRPRSAECYFERAIVFRPDDPQLHMLFGVYLHKAGRPDEARAEYERAEAMGLQSAELFYNRGLLEFEDERYDVSREYARRAYRLGYPLPGLRNKLEKKGLPL